MCILTNIPIPSAYCIDLHVSVEMYICIHIYMHFFGVSSRTYMYIHKCIHMYMYIFVCVCIYIYIYLHICMYIYI